MQKGNENWKWGLVVLLLTVFLITANQAYQHIASQEDFAPPDEDYRDSWDLEHQNGPGASQPIQYSSDQEHLPVVNGSTTNPKEDSNMKVIESIVIEDGIDWNQSNK